MSSISAFTERFESGARKALPYSLMFALLLMNCVSLPYVALGVKAPFFLMGLYYWSIYRPTLIPAWMAFAAGIIADLLGGLPLGLSAGIFVLAQWIVIDQRRFLMGQSFAMIWFGFLILSAFTLALEWAVFGAISFAWTPWRPLAYSLVLGQTLFPLVCMALRWTHKILPAPARSLDPR